MGENAEKKLPFLPCVLPVWIWMLIASLDEAGGFCQLYGGSLVCDGGYILFIAALLNGVFEVHGRITGRFVLQEAMERCLYREEKTLREME